MPDKPTPEHPCTCFKCKNIYTDREYPPDWAKGLCPPCNAPDTFAGMTRLFDYMGEFKP